MAFNVFRLLGGFLLLLSMVGAVPTTRQQGLDYDPCSPDPCHETAECHSVGGPKNHGGGIIQPYCLCKDGGGEIPLGESCMATDDGEAVLMTCEDRPCADGQECMGMELYPYYACLPRGMKPTKIQDLPPNPCEGSRNPCHSSAFCDFMYTERNTVEVVCTCDDEEEVGHGTQCQAVAEGNMEDPCLDIDCTQYLAMKCVIGANDEPACYCGPDALNTIVPVGVECETSVE